MLRCCIALLVLLSGGHCLAGDFGFTLPARTANLFETTDEAEPAEEPDDATSIDEMIEQSSWRNFSIEGYNGLIASKHSNWSGGVGFAFSIWNEISISIRAEYNMELGGKRDYRPQTRALMLEPNVRFHLDFSRNVALFSNHGPSIVARYDYYQLDERVSEGDLGRVFSLAVGSVNTVGLEFGGDFVRGFVESGLRTHFVVVQDADDDVEGYRDDIRDGIRFQWIVFRIGVRLHF